MDYLVMQEELLNGIDITDKVQIYTDNWAFTVFTSP